MKHLFILIVAVVGIYIAWQVADKKVRQVALSDATYHLVRLGALILGLLALLAVAMYLPSSVIF